MSVQELPFYPSLPAFGYFIVLDGVNFELIYEYSDQRESWYLTVNNAEGTRLVTRQRLTPGADLVRRLTDRGPAGLITMVSNDPYRREDPVMLYLTADQPPPTFEPARNVTLRRA